MEGNMKIEVAGCGAVSPAGWGMEPLIRRLDSNTPLPTETIQVEGTTISHPVRRVPKPEKRPDFMRHPRLRRASPITHFAVSAAMEALGEKANRIQTGELRAGLVFTVMTGCVNYSRRFYGEVLQDPAAASPIVFPETVFNAPASHLAALLQTTTLDCTLVGDPGTFLTGLAIAAHWLQRDLVDVGIVVGTEEMDWLSADASRLFSRQVLGEGAGAVCLGRHAAGNESERPLLERITTPFSFSNRKQRVIAARRMRSEMPTGDQATWLVESSVGIPALDEAEQIAWSDFPGFRSSPKQILGESLAASAAWQTVLAIQAILQSHTTNASVSVVGCNQQAIGAHFCLG